MEQVGEKDAGKGVNITLSLCLWKDFGAVKLEASVQQLHVFLAAKHHSASARERQGRGRKGKKIRRLITRMRRRGKAKDKSEQKTAQI